MNRGNFTSLLRRLLAVVFSAILAVIFRFEGTFKKEFLSDIFSLTLTFISVYYLVSLLDKVCFGAPKSDTFEEFYSYTRIYFFTSVIAYSIFEIVFRLSLPRSIPLLTSIFCLGFELIYLKYIKIISYRSKVKSATVPIAIYGAGEQGQILLKKIISDKDLDWKPIAFIDDDLKLSTSSLNGVRVIPTRDLMETLRAIKISILIISFSSISQTKINEIAQVCKNLNIDLRIIPSMKLLTGQELEIEDIRTATVEEILGKRDVKIDLKSITQIYSNKIVLITGAGGSIGSEITRQILSLNPKKVYLLDRDDTLLWNLNLSIQKSSHYNLAEFILADIRDELKVEEICNSFKPDIILHTAALKHLSILEIFPEEALKTNVLGTANLIRSAQKLKSVIFINISTDKAADPISVLGKSKLYSERMVAQSAIESPDCHFISVRFGNVFGSRGSVVHIFKHQIEIGGPVTITDRNVTRFFMTIEEAVHLVLKSPMVSSTGDTLILEMGNPVKIYDLAKELIKSSNKSVEITFTGLKFGEKLHESLVGIAEIPSKTTDDFIYTTKVKPGHLPAKLNTWQEFESIFNS